VSKLQRAAIPLSRCTSTEYSLGLSTLGCAGFDLLTAALHRILPLHNAIEGLVLYYR